MPMEIDRIFSFWEIVLGYMQYLAIITDIDIDWPDLWRKPIEWMKIASLNIRIDVFKIPPIDYRTYFLVIAVLVPLTISAITLLFFKPFFVLVWYFFLLLGLAAIVAGGYVTSSPGISLGKAQILSGQAFLLLGISVVVVCLIIGAIYVARSKSQRARLRAVRDKIRRIRKIRVGDVSAEKLSELEERERRKKSKAVADADPYNIDEDAAAAWDEAQKMKKINEPRAGIVHYLIMFGLVMILVVLGLITMGVIDLSKIPSMPVNQLDPLISLGKVAGYVFLSVAGVIFVYQIVTIFQGGRNAIKRVSIFFDKQFIRIILFVLLVTYIPVANVLLTSWSCATITCPAGFTLPYKSRKVSASDLVMSGQNSSFQCIPCNFVTSGCPWEAASSSASSLAAVAANHTSAASVSDACTCSSGICTGISALRFKQDSGIACSEVRSFFGPIS